MNFLKFLGIYIDPKLYSSLKLIRNIKSDINFPILFNLWLLTSGHSSFLKEFLNFKSYELLVDFPIEHTAKASY